MQKYKIHLNNEKVKIPGYYLAMDPRPPVVNPSIEEGGDIELPNGDILHIGPKMGPCGYDDEYEGIGLTLESGNDFIAWFYLSPLDTFQETGFGAIYDYDEDDMYAEGNFFRIYDLQGAGLYDQPDCWQSESELAGFTFYVIVIKDGEWVLVTDDDPLYYGNTVTLYSGEEIYVSNMVGIDGNSIYFTRSSGDGCYAFLKWDDDEVENESAHFWMGLTEPLDDYTTIVIYDFGSDGYDEAIGYSGDYSEGNVSDHLSVMCVLRYNEDTHMWEVEEDYT